MAFAGTNEDIPFPSIEKGLNALQGEVVRLVRDDADRHAVGGEPIEDLGDAGKRHGRVLPVARVSGTVFLEDGGDLFLGLRAHLGREDVAGKVDHAIADEDAVGIERMRREAAAGENVIAGVGKVLQGVEKGAVEVEEDSFGGGAIHGVGERVAERDTGMGTRE